MAPADQGLDAADLVVPEIDDGLVVHLELARRQRLAKVGLHRAAHLHLCVHLRPEEAVGVAPVGLGAIEREIGVPDQLVGVLPVCGPDCDADARSNHDLRAVEVERHAESLDDAKRQCGGIGGLRDVHLNDRELVAAHARDRIRLADDLTQACGGHLEQLVAGGVSERIVDRLEVVEIEQVDSDHLAPLDPHQGVIEPLVEEGSVRQVGERVVQRHVHDPGLGAPLVGDVLMRDDVPAVCGPAVADVDAPPVRQLVHLRRDLAELGEQLIEELAWRRPGVAAPGDPMLEYLAHGGAGLHLLEVQAVHLRIAPVADDEALLVVVHGQALGHVVHGRVELLVLLLELLWL